MLEELARPLQPRRAPYYVRANDVPPELRRNFPADGWYWIPPDGVPHVPVFMARNTFEARDVLLELRHRQEEAEEAMDAA